MRDFFTLSINIRPIFDTDLNKKLLIYKKNSPVLYPAFDRYVANDLVSWVVCQNVLEQLSLLVNTLWLWTYIPVNSEDLDGQHIGVVTYACLNSAPWSRIACRVLGMKLSDPSSTSWSSVKIKIMLGFRSLDGGVFVRCFLLRPLCWASLKSMHKVTSTNPVWRVFFKEHIIHKHFFFLDSFTAQLSKSQTF